VDSADDLRRSQSSVPKEAVDMFGLADEEDMERGRPSHLVKGNGVNMSVSKREKFLNKKNEVNAISMFQAESKQGARRPTIKVKQALKEAGISKSEKKRLLLELENRK